MDLSDILPDHQVLLDKRGFLLPTNIKYEKFMSFRRYAFEGYIPKSATPHFLKVKHKFDNPEFIDEVDLVEVGVKVSVKKSAYDPDKNEVIEVIRDNIYTAEYLGENMLIENIKYVNPYNYVMLAAPNNNSVISDIRPFMVTIEEDLYDEKKDDEKVAHRAEKRLAQSIKVKYTIGLVINTAKMFELVKEGKKINNSKMIFSLLFPTTINFICSYCYNDNHKLLFMNKIKEPVKYEKEFTLKDCEILKSLTGITLFKYQVDDIRWMKKVEYNVRTKYTIFPFHRVDNYAYVTTEPNGKGDIITVNLSTYETNFNSLSKIGIGSMSARGGMILDEIGSGKTAVVIGHLLYSGTKSEENPRFIDITEMSFNQYKNESVYISECMFGRRFLYARGTLIIVPKHLVKQWENELQKLADKEIEYKIISEFSNLADIQWKSLLDVDIVILSNSILTNPKFIVANNINGRDICTEKEIIHVKSIKMSYGENIIHQFMPLIHCIYWNRIIVDEAHEMFRSPDGKRDSTSAKLFQLIGMIHSRYFWYITGTMPLNEYITSAMSMLINVQFDFSFAHIREKDLLFSSDLDPLLSGLEKLVRRNTAESISKEKPPGEIDERVELIEMTGDEWINYNNLVLLNGENDESVRKFCTCPQIHELFEECTTPEEMSQKLFELSIEKINSMESEIRRYEEMLENNVNYVVKLQQIVNPTEIQLKTLDEKLSRQTLLTNYLDNLRKNYNNYLGCKKYFANVCKMIGEYIDKYGLEQKEESTTKETEVLKLEDLSDSDDEEDEKFNCPICLRKFIKPTMTICGHVFCLACLLADISLHNKCSLCKKPLNEGDFIVIVKEKTTSPTNNKYGSKMTKILGTIMEILKDSTNRIIIFSQWNRLLELVANILKEEKIEVLKCMGNAKSCNSAVKKFSESDKYKIIMLSSEHSASGLSLSMANYVLIVDPIRTSSYKELKQIEDQAIGRANRLGQTRIVHVIRFIMKKTIEEKIWNDQQKDMREYKESNPKEIVMKPYAGGKPRELKNMFPI